MARSGFIQEARRARSVTGNVKMCGRYALSLNLADLMAEFMALSGQDDRHGNPLWDWEPHYNISPGTVVPVIAYDGQKRRKAVPMRWGLHPHWKKEAPEGRPLFNARVETAHEKASFRTPFRRRRALIPASGWYEWEGVEKPKTPYFIREDHESVFAFAGLWDQWRVEEGVTLLSCTILTTAAVGPIKHIHHRMPVRLPKSEWENWLNPESQPGRVMDVMRGGDDLVHFEVGSDVNSGRAEGPELIRPV